MRFVLGARTADLTSRALVMGVLGATDDPHGAVRGGADLVELGATRQVAGVAVCRVATGDDEVEEALAAGADVLRLPAPSAAALRSCAGAGASVLVPATCTGLAAAAGLPPDRILPDSLLVDVTTAADPVAAMAVGVVRGGRIVRCAPVDVGAARRVSDVVAAVLEAR